ncbi:MAG TPA: hypothetical protein VHT75_18995 [Acidimicrobiales bacterium]|nr:hypothetical protein [Acidimicrobiales bacterium]
MAVLLALSSPAAACTAFKGSLTLDAATSTLTVSGFAGNMGDCDPAGSKVGYSCPVAGLPDEIYDVELLPKFGSAAYETGGLHHECMATSPHRTIGQVVVEGGEGKGAYGPPVLPGQANIDPGDSYALCIYDDYYVSGNEIRVTII